MCKEIIASIFKCPECGSDIKFKNSSGIVCSGCKKVYEYDDGLIDFGVEEQKTANNWSGSTSEEDLQKYFKSLVKEGYFIEEDIPNIYVGIEEDEIKKHDNIAYGTIRSDYYLPQNIKIVDLATGWASIFDSDIGTGMNYKKLKGKTIILTDLSRYVLQKVRETLKVKSEANGFNVIYAVCDIRNLPIKDNTVDYISSIACFGNSDSNNGVLDEMKRVLDINRKFSIYEFLYEENSRSQKYLLKDGGQREFTTPEGFKNELIKAGFDEININVLDSGYAKNNCDILPLKGEKHFLTLISAVKKP